MAIVNKFNVNGQVVDINNSDIDITANNVSYDNSFQYDENTVGEKLSELEGKPDLINRFDSNDPDNGTMEFFGKKLSHKIYVTSRFIYCRNISVFIVYDSSNQQLSWNWGKGQIAGGALTLNTIAENLGFAYIRVGYLDGTFVEEGTEDYYSAYKTDANIKTFVDKKFFNQVNPNDSYFGMSNWGFVLFIQCNSYPNRV